MRSIRISFNAFARVICPPCVRSSDFVLKDRCERKWFVPLRSLTIVTKKVKSNLSQSIGKCVFGGSVAHGQEYTYSLYTCVASRNRVSK